MPMSKDLVAAISFFELCLREDPNECQVERWKIERAMKIAMNMKRGIAVRDDEVRFVVGTTAKLACDIHLKRIV